MIITKKAIPRRTLLRGLGMSLALPLLDSMVPALTALRHTAAQTVRRLGVVYVPNGIAMPFWTPARQGRAFEFTPILEPLAPFRENLLVLSGLTQKSSTGEGGGNHHVASTKFLTGVPGKKAQYFEIAASTSVDQIAALELGRHTQLASLELALDGRDLAGTCDNGYSCAYTNTISWRSATTPLPMENNPRAVFERLFGDGQSTEPAARLARMQKDRSILDSVTAKITRLEQGLGPGDRAKIREYLEAVRDVERRIQKAEEQDARDLPVVEQPAGIPATFEEHATLMFDLQALAYQCDLTRVITFMMGRELTGRTYPEIGVPDSHHPLSHHQDDPAKVATMSKINVFHSKIFARYLERLRSTPDGDGSLLDHTMMLYGAGMSNSNSHSADSLPLLLVGGGGGQLQGGRHLGYSANTPVANLHIALLEKLGLPVERFGEGTGPLDYLAGL